MHGAFFQDTPDVLHKVGNYMVTPPPPTPPFWLFSQTAVLAV